MKLSLVIDWKEIKALLPLASTDQSRYVLNGIFVEIKAVPNGHDVVLAATDGRRLGVLRSESATNIDIGDQKSVGFIIPSEFIKNTKVCTTLNVSISLEDLNLTISEIRGTVFQIKAVDGTYPNYRMVVPNGTYVRAGGFSFNLDYLDGFQKVGKALYGKSEISILWPKEGEDRHLGPSLIHFDKRSFLGVMMPMRDANSEISRPNWIGPFSDPEVPQPTSEPEATPVPA